MDSIKHVSTFEEGLDFDTTPSRMPSNRLRKCINMELLKDGEYVSLRNIRGDRDITSYLSASTDLATLNVLGMFECQALYDLDGDNTFEQENFSIIIFKYDALNGSEIILIDLKNQNSHLLYPNANDSTSLNFPPKGTISASYTKERGTPEIYWDDNKNELRKLVLKYSTATPSILPSIREMSVRRRYGGLVPELVSIQQGGALKAGSYQFAYRLFSSANCNTSDWSLFMNPVPIPFGNCGVSPYDEQLGGSIGLIIDKKIVISIQIPLAEQPFYDSIQLAVIKNIDGLTIPSDTVYITTPSKDWFNNPTNIIYDGNIPETLTTIDAVVIEDASIESAKTQVIKDNRLFRANIKYIDFKNDRGSVSVETAETIKTETDYKCEPNTTNKKGHFRRECYAFAIAYYDEYFNFGLVEPLDLSAHHKDAVEATFTVTSVISLLNNKYTLFTSGNPVLNVGDVIKIGTDKFQVFASTLTSIDIQSSGTIPTTGVYSLLKGQKGNQANTWSWKFPDRCDNQFTLLSQNSTPQALGLKISVKNHPTWAKGFVILRQKRKENIVYQTPHIPTIAVRGVPTQGVGAITYSETNTEDVDDSLADYKKEYDHICPKIFGLGHAKNIGVIQNNLHTEATIGNNERFYSVFYPVYMNQYQNFSDATQIWNEDTGNWIINNPYFNAEIPNYIVGCPPEYVFNKDGEPTYPINLVGTEQINIVDAIVLQRKILQEDVDKIEIANTYHALTHNNYFYHREPRIIKDWSLPTQYDAWFTKIQDIVGTSIENIKAEKQIMMTLASDAFTLPVNPCSSKAFNHITMYGNIERLATQQAQSNAVPGSVNYFLGLGQNQRLTLLRTSKKILDFTKKIYDGIYGGDNTIYFPNIVNPDAKVFDMTHLLNTIGYAIAPSVGDKFEQIGFQAEVNNIFTDNNEVNSAAYILNIEKGLSDDRYSKESTDWIFTGTAHELTTTEVTNNDAITVEVWGGDCFITKASIKINNNTPRISDIYENIHAEADDYESLEGSGNPPIEFRQCVKTGDFKTNAEFIECFLETKVNTTYHEQLTEFPAYIGNQIGNYSKPYFYQYNGGYSVNNESKVFASKSEDCKSDNKNKYPARIVYSDQRLYQADGTGFVDTDGFNTFRTLNKFDLDEKYGGITSLVDFGDDGIHSIQEFKVRFDPVGRDIAETADGKTLVLGSSAVLGRGGFYLGYDNGSQHIRTIKQHNGICFFVDAKKKEVVMFGSRGSGFKVISDIRATSYFNTHLKQDAEEQFLSAYINPSSNANHYWFVRNDGEQKVILFSLALGAWEREVLCDKIYNATFANKEFYISASRIYEAHTGSINGKLLGEFKDSLFRMILNKSVEFVKVFNTQVFNMQGEFIINNDIGIFESPSIISTIPNYFTDELLKHTSYITPPPFQTKNYQFWLNKIRNKADNNRIRGHYGEVEYIIKNNDTNRRILIDSITTLCEASYRNL